MIRAIFRTVGVFGTIFAAGYVAQRYFGWDPKGLLNQAKDKLGDVTSGNSDHLKAPIRDTVGKKAV
jgi:hypothetical protein